MIPFVGYKVCHLLGVLGVVAALAGMCAHAANGGAKDGDRLRTLAVALHGGGLLLALAAGFGMLARLGVAAGPALFPGWVWAKVVLWLLLAAAAAVPYRRPGLAGPLLVLIPLLGALAGALAVLKPF